MRRSMQSFWLEVTNFFENTIKDIYINDIIDIVIVAIVIYQLLKLTRQTRADQVFKGLVLIFICSAAAKYFTLQAFDWLLSYVINAGAVALVVLFQPELRAALERVGRRANIENVLNAASEPTNTAKIVDEMVRGLINLSKRKVGALIVIEQHVALNDVLATGTLLRADISAALIENIFEPNTPLHDGAVVIRGTRIAAAGCFLHLTQDTELSRELGTRHRAALGISEESDCASLVVSEETGIISYAVAGKLTRYLDAVQLKELITPLFTAKQKDIRLPGILKRRDTNEKEK